LLFDIFWPSAAITRPFTIKFLKGALLKRAVDMTNNV
jgi:hypothetical protein